MPFTRDRLMWLNEVPLLEDVFERGGQPGIAYLWCPTDMEFEAQQAGWTRVKDSPTFLAIGPKGRCQFVLVQRGTPLIGIAPESGRRACEYDNRIFERTGIDPVQHRLEEDHVVETHEELQVQASRTEAQQQAAPREAETRGRAAQGPRQQARVEVEHGKETVSRE